MIKPPSACLPPNKMLLASLYLVLMKPWTVDLIHRDDAVQASVACLVMPCTFLIKISYRLNQLLTLSLQN